MSNHNSSFTYRQLAAFFIPLGFSASLTSITHVIINGTLSRGEDAAFIIACYAVAFSLFGIIERPIIVFRQTCSALVKDLKSFKQLNHFMMLVIGVLIGFCMILSFTPIEGWVYIQLFNANENMVTTISRTFKVITLVIIFSGIRGIYQGIIINQLETKWLSIMVVIRLCAMFLASYLFVIFGYVTSMTGAMIFLIGMMIECVISVWKGHSLLKEHYQEDQSDLKKTEILNFYFPLVFYFLIQTMLIPVIYVFLSKSNEIELSIASFALAFSITQMLLSFFMYTHQLVLQLFEKNQQKVITFFTPVSLLPALSLIILCYTPAGLYFMETLMGADKNLAVETLVVLKFFIIKTLVFPWVDFLNGFLMLRRKTRRMLAAQLANMAVVFIALFALVASFPYLNGVNGALAASLGELTGLIIVSFIVYHAAKQDKLMKNVQ
ncbi:multi antimicrobial extrusion protein MatE [Jeotgalibacillus sp. S-D1]|uniref:multi antimicrobial extrusion protein MatE n=1 Tax=Jeotgalibacillus sp. S-D1 TaxID=2552189 RepID=UPI001059885A|nr:multi antimicrobial extrusion protein MatE [Jeotgalibacillus sp. S-D1]TDL34254.1 multi antimicrobial extrusion protein MatE [Jeotgalibacillus sp. S-D1]